MDTEAAVADDEDDEDVVIPEDEGLCCICWKRSRGTHKKNGKGHMSERDWTKAVTARKEKKKKYLGRKIVSDKKVWEPVRGRATLEKKIVCQLFCMHPRILVQPCLLPQELRHLSELYWQRFATDQYFTSIVLIFDFLQHQILGTLRQYTQL